MRRDEAAIHRFGANLRAARLKHGMSQTDLAREAGLAVSEISRIERGVRKVRRTTLLALVAALDAEPADLLHGVPIGAMERR